MDIKPIGYISLAAHDALIYSSTAVTIYPKPSKAHYMPVYSTPGIGLIRNCAMNLKQTAQLVTNTDGHEKIAVCPKEWLELIKAIDDIQVHV